MATVTQVASTSLLGISRAMAVNEGGMVVGQQDGSQAFLWVPNSPNDPNGTQTMLPPLFAGWGAIANGLDSAGNAVGSSSDGFTTRAVFWPVGAGTAIDVGTMAPGGVGNSEAFGINDFGRIVGEADDQFGVTHAFRIDPGFMMQDLGTFSGSGTSTARGVNNSGDVVGGAASTDANGNDVQRAFLFENANPVLVDLLTLLPSPAGGFFGGSTALAIDDTGEIVGWSEAGIPGVQLDPTPVFFQRGGNIPVPIFPGIGVLSAVNGGLRAVGDNGSPPVSGFSLDRSSFLPTDLTALIGQSVLDARGINSSGQIAANLDGGSAGSMAILITP